MDINFRKIARYLGLQIKRVLRYFPAVFCITLILAVMLGLVGLNMISQEESDEQKKMLEIAVVGNTTDSYLGIGIYALKQLDSSRFAIEIHELSEEEARKGLVDGWLTAYVVIPDNFIDSIVRGENLSVDYYTRNGQAGLGVMLMQEFTDIVSAMIVDSQNAIYGMQSFCRAYSLNDQLWTATDELNIQCIEVILSRTQAYELEILGVSNQLSLFGYYICGLTVLFFLIWGVNGCPLFVRRDMSMANLLSVDERGPVIQVICEFLAYFLLMAASLLGIAALIGAGSEMIELSTPEWGEVNFRVIMSFAGKLLPMTAMLTALALMGHELVSNIISGMLLQFLGAIVLGYVSGCFYPSSFFPAGIQKLGALLPSGVAMQYASGCMRSQVSVLNVLFLLGYLILFLAVTVLLRYKKIIQR